MKLSRDWAQGQATEIGLITLKADVKVWGWLLLQCCVPCAAGRPALLRCAAVTSACTKQTLHGLAEPCAIVAA